MSSYSRSVYPTYSSSSSASSEVNTSVTYGVDWSERARPTSHCWFPYKPTDPPSSQSCAFVSCKDPKSTQLVEFAYCESCSLIVHTHHLHLDLQSTVANAHFIAPCRPSFSESSTYMEMLEQNKFDRHFWTHVSILTKPCALCKRKSASTSFFSSGRPSTMPSPDTMTKGATSKIILPDSSSPKMTGTSNGFQCLWCLRGYHRRCWEQVFSQDDKSKCDYGVLR